jgi:hypothetical protein
MALLVSTIEDYLEAALGGSSAAPYTTVNIVNHAGQWLINARPWKWCEGAQSQLSLVQDQAYIALPDKVRSVTSIVPVDGLTVSFEMTTIEDLEMIRTMGTVAPLKYWGAITHTPVTGAAPSARLQLYPTPTENKANFFLLTFSQDWVPVSSGSDAVPIPSWMEPLFIWSCTEVVRAFEEYDKGAEQGMIGYDRLSRITQSKMWAEAVSRDGFLQPNLGRLRNGATETAPHYWDTRFHVAVTDPK